MRELTFLSPMKKNIKNLFEGIKPCGVYVLTEKNLIRNDDVKKFLEEKAKSERLALKINVVFG